MYTDGTSLTDLQLGIISTNHFETLQTVSKRHYFRRLRENNFATAMVTSVMEGEKNAPVRSLSIKAADSWLLWILAVKDLDCEIGEFRMADGSADSLY